MHLFALLNINLDYISNNFKSLRFNARQEDIICNITFMWYCGLIIQLSFYPGSLLWSGLSWLAWLDRPTQLALSQSCSSARKYKYFTLLPTPARHSGTGTKVCIRWRDISRERFPCSSSLPPLSSAGIRHATQLVRH